LALLPDVNAVEADNAYALALEACEEALEWEQARHGAKATSAVFLW
jgi:hypothetical protein